MSVFTGGPYGNLAVMLNTLSSLNIEIISIIIIIIINIIIIIIITLTVFGRIWKMLCGVIIPIAGYVDITTILNEFEFRPDWTTDYRVSCR